MAYCNSNEFPKHILYWLWFQWFTYCQIPFEGGFVLEHYSEVYIFGYGLCEITAKCANERRGILLSKACL